MHFVLEENKLKSRVIIVGDVHGCFEELTELLERCSFNELEDVLVFVGDLVNKGPSSVEVVRYIHQLSLREVAYSVIGNHDEAMLKMVDKDINERPSKYSYVEQLLK